jgi:methionine--tRNA ligase beta chain
MAWADNFISANDFDSIRLSVASQEDILNWSYGEVTKPETINYRTQKPERDGLFCERIFGPVKDINPNDPKLKGVRSREAAVDKDGNLVTKSISRRERMGHISLAAPVAHIWFMHGTPSALSLLLDLTVKNIEKVVYFASYLIIEADDEEIQKRLEDLEAQTDVAKQAINARYAKEAHVEGANLEKLAAEQTKELDELEAMSKPARELPEEPLKDITNFDNFAALDLRAVKVLSCEKVPKSDKLLKFIVDDGFGERQVLSGIAKYYEPEQLVGKTLAMIVNLAPRKMMGLESNGMIMSVRDGDKFRVVEFGDDIKAGADIS